MTDITRYRSFIEEFAPLGYARLYVRHGDFTRAQHALEKTLVEGYPVWSMRDGLFQKDRLRVMLHLVDTFGTNGAGDLAAPPHRSSFSHSRKLMALEEAVEFVRGFDDDEQMALVLLFVEELPDERVLGWLGRDAAFLESLRARLRKRLEAWRPSMLVEEEPFAFFQRALRQYRLSAQFCPTVIHRLQTTALPGSLFPWIITAVMLVGVPCFFMVAHILDRWDSAEYFEGYRSMGEWLQIPVLLFVDLFLLTAAFLLRRYLLLHAPDSLRRGPVRAVTPVLMVAVLAGCTFVVLGILFFLKPRVFLRDESLAIGYALLHAAWWMGGLLIIMTTAYQIAVHYLHRADRRRAPEKGADPR